jgi:alanine racemase
MSPSETLDRAARRSGATLTIDLDAIVENYRRLEARMTGKPCAPVIKADAYGLGAERVGPALARAGARLFFVALPEEGIALRRVLAASGAEPQIFILNGLFPDCEDDFVDYRLVPVLNSLGEIEAWRKRAAEEGRPLPAAVNIDTGMSRLGLPDDETDKLADDPSLLDGLSLSCWISHLACADEPKHPKNTEQLAALLRALSRLPKAPVSLANSSGLFLGPEYHFDLGRPGAALFGINPQPGKPNPMAQVIDLKGKILQVREIDALRTVGYGATHRATWSASIATVSVGYADGYLRSLSNRGHAWVGGKRVPIVGRVSMDLITIDVSTVPRHAVHPGAVVEIIGSHCTVDDVATAAGTIGYEILTRLGNRFHRRYVSSA